MDFTFWFQVSEECEILRKNLAHVEGEWQSAKDQVSTLQVKVSGLEAIIQVRNTIFPLKY